MADYVNDPLNEQASVLVDVQTDIKTAVKKGVLANAPVTAIKAELRRVINRALRRIRSPTLQGDARVSLMRFSDKIYTDMRYELRTVPPEALPFVCIIMKAITGKSAVGKTYAPGTEKERAAVRSLSKIGAPVFQTYQNEIPLQEFTKIYIDKVRMALDGVAKANAIDPNDLSGRNSLRNLAEMQVRYEAHQQAIQDFKNAGVRLVVASSHADCSERCAIWQGRVYSLDGSRGMTSDGRMYVPLEEATDIFYTTKAGRTYKNGLLGFNCRHKLYEYRVGMGIPNVTATQRKKEYAITQTQRSMERGVIGARDRALAYKGEDVEKYREWRRIAIERNKKYQAFCKANGRAFYPDRVKIL